MMVKPEGYGQPMLLVAVDKGVATCLHIDDRGRANTREIYARYLVPMREALQPRSCWPTITHKDLIQIEEEEARAAAEKLARNRSRRRAKPSRRIKRKSVAA